MDLYRSVLNETAATKKVQFYANQTSLLQLEVGVRKKLDTISFGKRKVKGENIERVEEIAFAAMQEMHVNENGTGRETSKKLPNCDNEALKMKLLEALGFAPSQKKQTTGLPIHEKTKNLNTKQNRGYQLGEVVGHKQSSGPIGNDFVSPDQTKPVMHSLARNKPPTRTVTKLQHKMTSGKKPIPSSISDHQLEFQEKNMFAFDQAEGKERSIERAISGHSSRSNRKRSDRKTVTIEPRRIYFPRQAVSDMSLPTNAREQTLPSHKKASSVSKEEVDFHRPPSKARPGFLQTSNEVPRVSSNDTTENNESQDMESPLREDEEEEQFPQSPREDQDTKSFEEDDIISKGFRKQKKWFSNVGSSKKPSSTKRVYIQEDKKTRKINQSSPSPLDTSRTEETMGSHEASEPHTARTFSQMTSVLEGFNTKLKSHTSKKSSEILSSALDKIRLQLQVVESQILADGGKLTNVGKSKRKRLESTFQEQHERLRILHDKYKEEVNQHLLDCRNTLEELEAYQMELKGSAERQKASQRKLLMQAEEAVKSQLGEADTCVSAVHKEARKKMNGLKQVLEEWMAEGEGIF